MGEFKESKNKKNTIWAQYTKIIIIFFMPFEK